MTGVFINQWVFTRLKQASLKPQSQGYVKNLTSGLNDPLIFSFLHFGSGCFAWGYFPRVSCCWAYRRVGWSEQESRERTGLWQPLCADRSFSHAQEMPPEWDMSSILLEVMKPPFRNYSSEKTMTLNDTWPNPPPSGLWPPNCLSSFLGLGQTNWEIFIV